MIKLYTKSLLVLFAVVVGCLILSPGKAHAASFNEGDIISDSLFNEASSMGASQINSFLNGFSSSCISPNNGFSAPDPTGYSPSGGFTYGGNVSAGQVIYNAAQAYNINPQVLLATLEKEQSLVTGGAGCSTLRYAAAVGYGCPDGGTSYSYSGVDLYSINGSTVTSVSGTCVNSASKVGFSQQVIRAAWLLKFAQQRSEGNVNWDVQLNNYPENGDVWNNSDDPQSCYGGPMTPGTWQICPGSSATYYDGYTTIDGVSVLMSDGATAALYYYTPHFSGNSNFYNIFTSWFGDSSQDQFPWEIAEASGGNGMYYLVVGNTKRWIPDSYEYEGWDLENYPLQQVSQAYLDSIPTIPNLANLGLMSNGQYVYVDNGQKYNLTTAAIADWGISSSELATAAPVNSILSALPTIGFADQYIQGSGTSNYYLMSAGNLYPINSSYLSSWSSINPTTLSSTALANFNTSGTTINNAIVVGGTDYIIDSGTLMNVSSSSLMSAYAPALTSAVTVDQSAIPFFYNVVIGSQLVQASNSLSWEILLGGKLYYVPSQSVAEAWGYNGNPQIISPTLYSEFSTGSTLGTTVEDTNGNYYILDGSTHYIPTSFLNDWLGTQGASVQIPASEIIPSKGDTVYSNIFLASGSANIFTMINGEYYYIQNGQILNGLGYPSKYQIMGLNPTGLASLTRSTSNATQFIVNNGTSYYMQDGTAYGLNPTYANLWTANTTPVAYAGTDFAQRFNISPNTYGPNINSASNIKYIVDNGSLLNVSSYADAYNVTSYMNLNVTNLPIQNTTGTYLARSSTTPSDTRVWLINGATKQWISNAAQFFGYGGAYIPTTSLSDTFLSSLTTVSGSPSILIDTGTLGVKFLVNGGFYGFPDGDTLTNIAENDAVLEVNSSIFNTFNRQLGNITRVIQDSSTQKIYYVSNGQLQWLADSAAYSHYANIPVTILPSYVISWFAQGSAITN